MSDQEEKAGTAESVELLRHELEDVRAKAEQYLSSWQRCQADFINYKRRTEQERCNLTAAANAELILKLLPALDDLRRAFKLLPDDPAQSPWADGFRLIEKKFQSVLSGEGLQEIPAVGRPFDPRFHEAAAYEEGGEDGVVLQETQKGYTFCDRVLRPSTVVVGRGRLAPQA